MTDIVITPANVIPGSTAVIEHGWAGATILAGQVVYLAESTDSRYRLADSNIATPAEVHTPRGIALHGATNGQPLAIAKSGSVTLGAGMVANVAYYLSDVPGGIAPIADVQALEYPTVLGMSTSTSVFNIDIQTSGGALEQMQAGRLRKRVRFQRANPAPDIGGGFAVTWADDLDLWADFRPQRGLEVLEAGRVAAQVPGVLHIRWSELVDGILPGDRVLIDGEPFNIRSVIDPDGRHIRLEMVVEKGVAT